MRCDYWKLHMWDRGWSSFSNLLIIDFYFYVGNSTDPFEGAKWPALWSTIRKRAGGRQSPSKLEPVLYFCTGDSPINQHLMSMNNSLPKFTRGNQQSALWVHVIQRKTVAAASPLSPCEELQNIYKANDVRSRNCFFLKCVRCLQSLTC